MKFTKMHGLGNDYIYVNCLEEHVDDPPALARAMSDRHTGIGSDGLILIRPSQEADLRMEIYNADGSRAQMCGNGIRCLAKYAVERRLAPGPVVRIDTDSGVRIAECEIVDTRVRSVRVDMGNPSLATRELPATISADRIIQHPLRVAGHEFTISCVSIGNPHAVVYVDNVDTVALEEVGPLLERAPEFPEGINVHFVRVDSPHRVTIRTWERGSGATLACGTGACAVCVAGVVTERTRRRLTATLPGGELELEWCSDDHVYMTGPAIEVFSGVWPR